MAESIILINGCKVKLIPYGICACGCGQKTMISRVTNKRDGLSKGKALKFIHGHSGNPPKTKRISSDGYELIKIKNHHRADCKGYVLYHILRAEKALGKPLPPKAVIHHHTLDQLVLCETNSYHMFLHQRQRAYEACGHANWRKCWICKQYDDPKNLIIRNNACPYHQKCLNAYQKNRSTLPG